MPDKLLGFTAGGTVADSNGLHPIFFCQIADYTVGRMHIGHRRMRENGRMFQQAALTVKHNHLAAGAEPRVNAHDHLFAQRRRQKKLPHIVGKHADGLFVSLYLGLLPHLGLHQRLQQTLVGIRDGILHLLRRFVAAFHMYAVQQSERLLFRRFHLHAQKALLLPAQHRQQAV